MDRMHQRRERMRIEANKLRELVEKKAPDAQVKAQLDSVVGLAGKDDDLHSFLGDTAKLLNVTEQAKLALSMPEIMHDVQRLVREARRNSADAAPAPVPAPAWTKATTTDDWRLATGDWRLAIGGAGAYSSWWRYS